MGGPGSGRRAGSDTFISKANDPANVNADVNARVMAFGAAIMGLEPVDYSNPDALQARFVEYLGLCASHGVRPMVTSAALAFHMDRHAFGGIGNGDKRYYNYKGTMTPQSVKVLQRCYHMLAACYETFLTEERGNPVKWLFLGKNYFGMRDQCEIVTYAEPEREERASADEIVAKYAAMVGRPIVGELSEGAE